MIKSVRTWRCCYDIVTYLRLGLPAGSVLLAGSGSGGECCSAGDDLRGRPLVFHQ